MYTTALSDLISCLFLHCRRYADLRTTADLLSHFVLIPL